MSRITTIAAAMIIPIIADITKSSTASEEDRDKIDLMKSQRLREEISRTKPAMLREANDAIAEKYREERRARKRAQLEKMKVKP